METVIPAGYRVSVASWENDGDAKRTITKEGLSREMAKFFVEAAAVFGSYGNQYSPSDAQLKVVHRKMREVIFANWEAFSQMWDDLTKEEMDTGDDLDSAIWDVTAELHYELLGGGDFRFRQMETIKVEHLPVEVRMKDVTGEFV